MSTFEKEAVVVGGNKIRDLLFDEQLPYATHKCFPSPSLVLELHEKNQVEAAGVRNGFGGHRTIFIYRKVEHSLFESTD